LNSLDYSNNPLTIQSIQVQRFLDRFNIINRNNSIYQDNQNVHDVTLGLDATRVESKAQVSPVRDNHTKNYL